MKKLFLILFLMVAFTSLAQDGKNKNAKYDVDVNGNCEMCKKRIEKAAFSVVGVKMAQYHIDDKKLHLVLNEQKCSLLDVQKALAKAGHDTKDIKASNEDYEKLHGCCQYERK